MGVGVSVWADFLMFVDGSKLVFDVSRYEELRLIDILVDFEDLMLFILGVLYSLNFKWYFLGDLEFA